MRVFAVALDGPLAHYEWGFIDYLNELYPKIDIDPHLPRECWGIPTSELQRHGQDFNNNAALINGLRCNDEAAAQMRDWAFEGLVPSVFVARKTETRLVTEMWLTQHSVPYSNLLFDTQWSEPQLCHHIDASFFVHTDITFCMEVAKTGVRAYFLIDEFNKRLIKIVDRYIEAAGLLDGMLNAVESFDEIRKYEGINGKL